MRMGIGLGVGINRSNYAQGLFASYQSRVVADGGTTEAGSCVDAGATALLQTASLLLIPSGYKALKLYSQIPTNGNGDFTWARTSTANRTNSSGNLELMATGVPRLDYSFSSCPMALLETQRTNLVFPSDIATTQTRTVTATAHTLSFYGTGTVVLSGVAIATLAGTGANDRVTLTFTPTAGSLILTVTGTVTNWQLEAGAGAFASTLIPTTTASATRLQDQCDKSGISSLIGQSEGTIFAEVYFTQISNAQFRSFFCLEGSVGSQFSGFVVSTTNNGNDVNYAGTNYILSTGRHKIACTYSQTNNQRKLFVDGVLRSTSTHTNFLATIDRVSLGCRLNPFSGFSVDRQLNSGSGIFDFALFNSLLSDAQCVALTTL